MHEARQVGSKIYSYIFCETVSVVEVEVEVVICQRWRGFWDGVGR
jgi:hypothetical protein